MPTRTAAKASTEGTEVPEITQIANSPAPEPEAPPAAPPAPDPVPATLEQKNLDTSMSPHIVHADVLANETQIKIAAYEAGIITLQSELNGAEQEKNRAIAKIEEEFAVKQADLLRRIDDLTLTKEMLTGALVVRDHRKAERDNAARDAAYKQEQGDEADTQRNS